MFTDVRQELQRLIMLYDATSASLQKESSKLSVWSSETP